MNNFLKIIFAVIGFTIIACAQKSEVSQKARQALEIKFPNAQKVSWEKEDANVWEAEFKMDGEPYSANFTENGDWVETEIEIEANEVPMAVSNSMKTKYAEVEIEEVSKIESDKGTSYEYEFKEGEKTREVVFDPSGKIIKSVTSDDDHEDDDGE